MNNNRSQQHNYRSQQGYTNNTNLFPVDQARRTLYFGELPARVASPITQNRYQYGGRSNLTQPHQPRGEDTILARSTYEIDPHERERARRDMIALQKSQAEYVSWHAKMLLFITKSLRTASFAIFLIIFALFCYSQTRQVLSSSDRTAQSPRLTIKLSSSGLPNSITLYESLFALSIDNRPMLTKALFYTLCFFGAMVYFKSLLVKILAVATEVKENHAMRDN